MIGKIIVFIVFVILVNMLRSFLVRVLSPASQGSRRRAQHRPAEAARKTISGQMVKDPVCGMYVATDLAVTANVKGEVVHFCSEECLDSYVNKLKSPD